MNDLLAPLLIPFDPSKRLFWGCIASSLVIAAAVVSFRTGRFDPGYLFSRLFDRHYWLTRSTAVDVAYLFGNNAIRVMILLPIVGSHLWFTLATGRFLQSEFGDAPVLPLPWFVIASTYALTFFLLEDASRFGLHYLMHRIPVLWLIHKVHHSATTLTPLTLHRVHPLESVLYFFRGTLVFGLVSGTFIWLFGRELTTFHVLGVDLLGFLFNMLGANLRHSHVWVSFGAAEKWFISPAQHQLHHSIDHQHVNLGTYLAVWDRLTGTSLPSGRPTDLRFGLASETENHDVEGAGTSVGRAGTG